jgi:hypothetical protein
MAVTAVLLGLGGCDRTLPATTYPNFPATSHWHADVRSLPVLANSAALVRTVGASSLLASPTSGQVR